MIPSKNHSKLYGKRFYTCLPASLQDCEKMVMNSYPYLLFLTLRSKYVFQGVSATCYTPSGQDRNLLYSEGSNVYLPCNKGDEFSMCCALNRPSHARPPDGCRRDGLCLSPDMKNPTLWRESCTDPSWRSPSCTRICLDGLCR